MIKLKSGTTLFIGISQDNVDELTSDHPLLVELAELGGAADITRVVVFFKPTLREALEELVGRGLLPQRVLDEWREPQPGQKRRVRP